MWEQIPDYGSYGSCDSARLSVPGGWVVRTILIQNGDGASVALVFCPNIFHTH